MRHWKIASCGTLLTLWSFCSAGALIVSETDPAPVRIAKSMAAANIVVQQTLREEFVTAKAELATADGTVLWSHTRDMNNHSDREIPAVPFDDHLADIEKLRSGYRAACGIVAKVLVRNLLEQ